MNILRSITLITACLCFINAEAQNPGGNAMLVDFDEFTVDNVVRYVSCPYDAALNVGNNLTMEAWVKIYDTSWNQKIMGRLDASFNNGYMMGIINGKCYTEIWSPSLNEMQEGFVLPQLYWVHFAVTFEAGGLMTTYVNGINEGSQALGPNGIADNSQPLIIGIAPWDEANFQTFGQLDEVRIWNVIRTEEQINDWMYQPLTGSETGLVVYYDFNEGSGTAVADSGPNGLNGTIVNGSDNNWRPSTAPIASVATATTNDLAAFWRGIGIANPRVSSTDQGMSLLGDFEEGDNNYAAYGHDAGTGTSTDNIATDAPAGFNRSARQWNMTERDTVICDVIIDLDNAAGSGTALDNSKDAEFYTLLWRADPSDDFAPVANGSNRTGSIVTFEETALSTGWYAIGVGEAIYETVIVQGLQDISDKISVYPNPVSEVLNVNWVGNEQVEILLYAADGKLVLQESALGNTAIDVSEFAAGIYNLIIRTATEQGAITVHIN